VVDAGGAQGLVGVLVDEAALARDERRRHRARLSADGHGDAARQVVARPVDGGQDAQPKIRARRRRLHLGAAGQGADCADAAEIRVAGEVVAARPGGFGRRQKACVRGDEVAGLEGLPVAHARPHAPGALFGRQVGEGVHLHHQARARLALLDALDEACQRRDDRAAEHRRLDRVHAHHAGREAEEESGAADRGGEARQPASGRMAAATAPTPPARGAHRAGRPSAAKNRRMPRPKATAIHGNKRRCSISSRTHSASQRRQSPEATARLARPRASGSAAADAATRPPRPPRPSMLRCRAPPGMVDAVPRRA
jgi:hypothetical protein